MPEATVLPQQTSLTEQLINASKDDLVCRLDVCAKASHQANQSLGAKLCALSIPGEKKDDFLNLLIRIRNEVERTQDQSRALSTGRYGCQSDLRTTLSQLSEYVQHVSNLITAIAPIPHETRSASVVQDAKRGLDLFHIHLDELHILARVFLLRGE